MIEPVLALVGLILSAFFSGSEIAFIQANPIQVEVWQKQGRKAAAQTSRLMADPERYLTTVLIGTNLANVVTSSYATITFISYGVPQGWTVILIAVIILLFGEILPKSFFRENATALAVEITPLMRFMEILITPFIRLVKAYSRILSRENSLLSQPSLTKEELRLLFSEAEVYEEVEEDELEVISKIFEFGTQPVKRAMTSRVDIVGIQSSSSLEEAAQIMSDTGLSKLPVYEESFDHIRGIVFLHDLFVNPDSLASITKRPLFIQEDMPASEALKELKRRHSSIAIVTRTDGRNSGLVTDEDLVEEIFGEFEDVFDEEGRTVTRSPDGSLVVDSLVEISELNQQYGFRIPEGNYDTIAGFLLARVGRIPRAGEFFDFGSFGVKILSATANRIKRLHLTKKG
ncbi:MAG: hemolysin family protein [Candidatus Marinimicrobia bacterium]|nr:hypothetical protein [Candidatus Neomarinimicrobiota bacterium]MDP6456162.1 hemolysin family protein [Candidatus Neomarinimicrobiota bacterium]MDP6593696.1 hemolysin family protein [Candidatus Neomarinimicrobiota bacterium]MDP6836373.1 hemolysin family protein [Candidatus Neomarinimicrobiota bacterium]